MVFVVNSLFYFILKKLQIKSLELNSNQKFLIEIKNFLKPTIPEARPIGNGRASHRGTSPTKSFWRVSPVSFCPWGHKNRPARAGLYFAPPGIPKKQFRPPQRRGEIGNLEARPTGTGGQSHRGII